MKTKRTLDLTLLREPSSMPILLGLPDDIETRLSVAAEWSEVHDRARASLRFLVKAEVDQRWIVEARLRAGLNEFYSMEDAANRAYRALTPGAKAPQIAESIHPLVHVMYSLRHVNVHIRPTTTRNEEVPVVYRSSHDPVELTVDAVMIEDSMVEAVLATREVQQYYEVAEMRKALLWLLTAQKSFGVGQVFRLGLERYCRELLRLPHDA